MFNFNEFVEKIHSHFTESFSKQEVEELLFSNSYEKDSPNSLGKRLVLEKLKIKGQKNTGTIIDYTKKIDSGVSVLYADNGKGKSSIFKIIRFALTGEKSSIKKDVSKWLHEIFLQFRIGNIPYTIFIDMKGSRVQSGLYKVSLEEFLNQQEKGIQIEEILIQFEANTETKFRAEMQNFFFDQFSYYSLRWTSRKKNSIDLTDNKTSWKTYYKSIYLESKDYNVLFLSEDYGQGKKILEMILGLKLTFAINSLTQTKDYLYNQLQKKEYIDGLTSESNNRFVIEQQLSQINDKISLIQQKRKSTFRKSIDLDMYNSLSKEIKFIEDSLQELQSEKTNMSKQIIQLKKNIYRLEEELAFGAFFSNLEVKMCPRCESAITSEKKLTEKNDHKCMLCESELTENTEEYEEILNLKLITLREQLHRIEVGFDLLASTYDEQERIKSTYIEKLRVIETKINSFNFEEKDFDELTDLIQKKLELEQSLKVDITNENSNGNLEEQIELLKFALKYLNKKRLEMSSVILNSLKKLILSQIHQFGLINIEEVHIDQNLELLFQQNGEYNKFVDLSEGEQLRAKIAFFLSLILLDIQFKVGRHPRLLIIDSPGKEEVISKDLVGLAKIFKDIENNYNNELQIIIGTALEPLKKATVSKKVESKNYGESVF